MSGARAAAAARATVAAGLWALAAVAVLALIVALTGHDPVAALATLWDGSFGSRYALASATLVRTTPLLLTGLAVGIAFRAGVWNIGAEGQLLVGAGAFTVLALRWGSVGVPMLVVALLAGAAAGAAWAGIAAWMRNRFGVLEVISTIMLNFVALHLVGWLVRGPLQEPLGIYPQSPEIPAAVRIGALIPGTRLHWGILLALGAAGVLWYVLRYSAAGFRIRSVGANPIAARTAGGIDTARTTATAFLVSGALAGVAGAVEIGGVTFALYENVSPGYGFTAIAVALLARLAPLWIIASALLFGALAAGAAAMQREAGIPSVVVTIVEALIILMVLAAGARSWFAAIVRQRPAKVELEGANG